MKYLRYEQLILGLETILIPSNKYQAPKKALEYLNKHLSLSEDKKSGFSHSINQTSITIYSEAMG